MSSKNSPFQNQTTYPALVGNVIAQIRKRKHLGQKELSKAMGLSQPTWSRIEKGLSALTIEQLAEVSRILGEEPYKILKYAGKVEKDLKGRGINILPKKGKINRNITADAISLIGESLASVVKPTLQRIISEQKQTLHANSKIP